MIATSWLTGCATVGSEGGEFGACPPVVEYSRKFQAQAAEELALLPEGSAVAEMLTDYAVMRKQTTACRQAFYRSAHAGFPAEVAARMDKSIVDR